MLDVWANSRLSLNREVRILKQNLKICKACEAVQGPCGRLGCVREDIAKSLTEALAEMGLGA